MKKIAELLITLYKRLISPLKPRCCRYYPSCSTYALEAVRLHGVIKRGILAVWRILRCNPYSRGGIDYVPKSFNLLSLKTGVPRRLHSEARRKKGL